MLAVSTDALWCEDLERLLRQRRILLRSTVRFARGYSYVVERSGRQSSVRVPRGAIGAGVYGLEAALAEIEASLQAAVEER